jgi:hypothetical protein
MMRENTTLWRALKTVADAEKVEEAVRHAYSIAGYTERGEM